MRLSYSEKRLAAFLSGEGPDSRGRMLCDILLKDDLWWEKTHDYIQWVFPTREKSVYNPLAPVVHDPNKIATPFMRESLFRFLDFLNRNRDSWIRKGNHNQLRISRVLASLLLFRYKEEASNLFLYLAELERSFPKELEEGMRYWRKIYLEGESQA